MKDYLIRVISKVNIIKYNIALKLNKLLCSVLMYIFPCPHIGSFVSLGKNTILKLCIYKSYIALILFMNLVKQPEYTLCTRKTHYNAVKLLAHLVDRLVEALIKCKEARKPAKSETAKAVKCKHTAGHCTHNVAYVTNLHGYRTHDVSELVGII